MNHKTLICKHFKSIFFGGNWTGANVKDTIASISLQQANTKFKDCNSIADLLFHINYYVEGILPVFDGGSLDIKDKFSYNSPNFETHKEWEIFKSNVLENAEKLYKKISTLSETKLFSVFADEKYGTFYSNIHGIIEHTHYHLGQIVVIKKCIETKA